MNENKFCRLCLKMVKKEFKEINELMTQIFDVLLLKLNLDIISDAIICYQCVEVAKKCLNFKFICIGTEHTILSFCAGRKMLKYDIRFIYKDSVHIEAVEDLDICRFCMDRLERSNFVGLDTSLKEILYDMLPGCMPEMDFNITKNPMICTTCRGDLQGYIKFVLNCQGIEGKLKYYRKGRTGNTSQVKLHRLHFLCKDVLEYSDKHPQICAVKVESNTFTNIENEYPEVCSELKPEGLNNKEGINLNENSYKNPLKGKLDKYSDMFSSKKCNEASELGINNYTLCTPGTKQQHVLENYTSEVTTKAKQKSNANRHILIQKDLSEGQSYESLQKDVFEIKMYRCSLCAFETKQKSNLRTHMLVHKDFSEVKLYICSLCAYKAKYKSCLKRHMLVHTDVSKLNLYKCPICAYEAKQKSNIKAHMLVHKDVSEVKTYKCTLCAYKAKYKIGLTRHLLVHKDVSQIKWYECSLCAFKAKIKGNLTKHMLIHTGLSETYKCPLCPYKDNRKYNLEKHMLVHNNNGSQIKMFKCSLCAYEAKRKRSLKSHMLIHKDVSDIQMYECSLCVYKAKYNSSLRRHMLVHKDASETTMYSCSFCTYKAKYKHNLKTHMLVHTDVSKIIM